MNRLTNGSAIEPTKRELGINPAEQEKYIADAVKGINTAVLTGRDVLPLLEALAGKEKLEAALANVGKDSPSTGVMGEGRTLFKALESELTGKPISKGQNIGRLAG